MWMARNMFESKSHDESMFLTCTYAPEHLPDHGSISKADPTNFLKRLRQYFDPDKIRVYHASEYAEPSIEERLAGIRFGRCHSHYLIYGGKFTDLEVHKKEGEVITYTSKTIADIWGKGFCTIGEVNSSTCAYVSRYIFKKIKGPKAADHYQTTSPITGEIIKLEPEYHTMSRRPGLGLLFFDKWKTDFFPSNFMIHDGRKIAVPKYFLNKLETSKLQSDRDMHAEIKERNHAMAKKQQSQRTPERLAVKEKILQLSVDRSTRGKNL